MRPVDAARFMGVRIDNVGLEDVCRRLHENRSRPGYICVNDVGNVVATAEDPELFRAIEGSLLTVADGMPLAWYARLLGYRRIERITGFDLMQRLLATRNGWRHYLLGDTEETIASVVAKARENHPDIAITGHSPPFTERFSDDENAAIVDRINGARPDVIWVSFGGGKQEKWMAANLSRLDRGIMIGVGAAFRFYIGQLYVPPKIVQKLGLQWFFRMLSDPVRWFKRPFRRKIRFALHAPMELTRALWRAWMPRKKYSQEGENRQQIGRSLPKAGPTEARRDAMGPRGPGREMMTVLILHTDPKDMGGVASYYRKLADKFTLPVGPFVVGRRPGERSLPAKAQRLVRDYTRFVRTLRQSACDIVHANPSLDRKSFLRDGLFLLLARRAGKPTVVTFHQSQEALLRRRGRWLFRVLYGKTNHFIVLSERLRNALQRWGCTQPIHREVTLIDDAMLAGFQIDQAIAERQRPSRRRILFLSRLHRDKGIYETLEALSILQTRYPELGLIVAGDGNELQGAKAFVRRRALAHVEFTGYVRGDALVSLFRSASLYCLPTYYPEGLPSTVVEAMAFGLPVVTRPVGGIADFFKNGEHGFATTSRAPAVIAELIEKLLTDEAIYHEISRRNYEYGQKHFLASRAALRLEQIYTNLLTGPANRSPASFRQRDEGIEYPATKVM